MGIKKETVRDIKVMYFWGMEPKEISEVVGIPESIVRSIIGR